MLVKAALTSSDLIEKESNMRRIIDLTFSIHEGMTTFPVYWHPAVEITVLGHHESENRETMPLDIFFPAE
jgi:kynurenine formamidase